MWKMNLEYYTFISSSGSRRGTPFSANLERTSETFFSVFSRASKGKRSFGIVNNLRLLKLIICS